jgi:acyl dehydratase
VVAKRTWQPPALARCRCTRERLKSRVAEHMSIQSLQGRASETPSEFSWDARDVRIYALGVGAESAFSSPGTPAAPLRPLPSFAVLPGAAARRDLDLSEIPRARTVHAEQHLEIRRMVATSGTLLTTCRVVGVWDKGSGALIETEAVSKDADSGEIVIVNRSGSFVRGAGGFGGERGPSASARLPDRDPDVIVEYSTSEDQALLYCLSGDENPLHWDPAFAKTAGFDRPILHGLCTYGIACRALVANVSGGDPDRLRSISARFRSVVFPGQQLSVSVWRASNEAWFRVSVGDAVVLDLGHCTFDAWVERTFEDRTRS